VGNNVEGNGPDLCQGNISELAWRDQGETMKKVKVPGKPKYNRIMHDLNASLEHYRYQYEYNERSKKRFGAIHDV
jgi:hypothetical protein